MRWEVLEEAEVPRTREGVRPGVGIELAVDVLDMRLDRADCHDERGGDLGIALPSGQQAQHHDLTLGERRIGALQPTG